MLVSHLLVTRFYETLQVGFFDDNYQISTIMMTFVQAIYGLAIFVHISNITTVTVPIFTKSLDPIFREP